MKNRFYILLLLPVLAFCQFNTVSPYSFYGIGDLNNRGLSQNILMGGISNALCDQYHVNFNNPSSYSFLNLTSVELAFGITGSSIQQNNLQKRNLLSNIIGLGIGFPISKNAAIALGFQPYSSVGYNVQYSNIQELNNIGELKYNFSGNGGLNRTVLGASYKFNLGTRNIISLGLNLNYYFGSLIRENILEFDTAGFNNYRENTSTIIRDFSFDFGMMINQKIRDKELCFGLGLSPSKDMKSELDVFSHTYTSSASAEFFEDTIYDFIAQEGNIKFPMCLNTGINFRKNDNWLVGLDYNYSNWKEYEAFNVQDNYMENLHEFILGGYFIPNKADIHNYWNRVEYRWGASYTSGYLNLNSFQNAQGVGLLKEYKFSLGLGMPIPKNKSQFNFGVQFGMRGETESSLVNENYINIILSMTFNDKWFKKRKIE